jgi:hypothetical protein
MTSIQSLQEPYPDTTKKNLLFITQLIQQICEWLTLYPDKLMKEMEVVVSLNMFKIAKQSVKDRKDVIGNRCIRDRFGKLCIGEWKRAQVWLVEWLLYGASTQ